MTNNILLILFILSCVSSNIFTQTLDLPPRKENSLSGSEFAKKVQGLSLEQRDEKIINEIFSGNIPSFLRELVPINFTKTIENKTYNITIFVTSDYMAVGSKENYLYTPMSPNTAQSVADSLGFVLPTKKIVDYIYKQADIKFKPQPIPPSSEMTTVKLFLQHMDSIKTQLPKFLQKRHKNQLIAGHKKDVIISNQIYDYKYKNVVIYGWHRSINNPIQPVYGKHSYDWVDYSHGIRLVKNNVKINNKYYKISNILSDSLLCQLLSDEGIIRNPKYPTPSE